MPKYISEVTKHFSGDKTLAARYMGVARGLLGSLVDMSGDVFQNARKVILPDGTKITVSFAGALAQIAIDVRLAAREISRMLAEFVTTPKDSDHPSGLSTDEAKHAWHSTQNRVVVNSPYECGAISTRYYGVGGNKPSVVTSIQGINPPRLDNYMQAPSVSPPDANEGDEISWQSLYARTPVSSSNGIRFTGITTSDALTRICYGSIYYINGVAHSSPDGNPIYSVWSYHGVTCLLTIGDQITYYDDTYGYQQFKCPSSLKLYTIDGDITTLVDILTLGTCSLYKPTSPTNTITTQAFFSDSTNQRDGQYGYIKYIAIFSLPWHGEPETITSSGIVGPDIHVTVTGLLTISASIVDDAVSLSVTKDILSVVPHSAEGAAYTVVSVDPINLVTELPAVAPITDVYLSDGYMYSISGFSYSTGSIEISRYNGDWYGYRTLYFTKPPETLWYDLRAEIVPESGAVIVTYFARISSNQHYMRAHVLFIDHPGIEVICDDDVLPGEFSSTIVLGDVSRIGNIYLAALDIFYMSSVFSGSTYIGANNRHIRINKLIDGESSTVYDITADGSNTSTYPYYSPSMVLWPSTVAVGTGEI